MAPKPARNANKFKNNRAAPGDLLGRDAPARPRRHPPHTYTRAFSTQHQPSRHHPDRDAPSKPPRVPARARTAPPHPRQGSPSTACAPPSTRPTSRPRRTWSSSAPPRPRATSTWRTRMILTTSPRSTRRILRWRQVRLAAAVGRAGAAPSCGQTMRASLASRGHQGSTGAGGDDGKNLYTKEIVVREIAGG